MLAYLGYLDREIELQAALFDRDRSLEHVVWGEEILSHLGYAQWRRLLLIIAQNFNLERNPSLWVSIRASALDPLKMRELKELPLKQLTVIADGEHALSNCIDLLPGSAELRPAQSSTWLAFEFEPHLVCENKSSFLRALEQAIELSPGRITLGRSGLWTAGPRGDERLKILDAALQRLEASDYVHLGLEVFTRADHELAMVQKGEKLNFILGEFCSARDCDWLPIGPGSVGKLNNAYFQNAVDPDVYRKRIEAGILPVASGMGLSRDDQIRGGIIEQLFCYACLDTRIEQQLGSAFFTYFEPELNALNVFQTDGLVSVRYPRIHVLPRGKLLVRSICRAFDRYRAY